MASRQTAARKGRRPFEKSPETFLEKHGELLKKRPETSFLKQTVLFGRAGLPPLGATADSILNTLKVFISIFFC
jgi:hypothetical protein